MTTTTGFARRGRSRTPTFGVAPYVPGRTTAEYLADGTLRAVEAPDGVAALAAYAAAQGLTVTAAPRVAKSGKQTFVTLSDGREYVARTLRAAHAELMETEPIVADPTAAPPDEAAQATDHESPPAGGLAPEPVKPASEPVEAVPVPPEPPEFLALDAASPADLAAIRSGLLPLSWSIAAALWGATGDKPQSVQAVAERFAVSPGFVRMVAASALHLASDEVSSAR